MKTGELMSRAEVMEYLKISHQTLYKLMKLNAFPYIKMERKVLFRKSDIDAYLEAHMVRPAGRKK
jgi:excisionase family DNA binding protein